MLEPGDCTSKLASLEVDAMIQLSDFKVRLHHANVSTNAQFTKPSLDITLYAASLALPLEEED